MLVLRPSEHPVLERGCEVGRQGQVRHGLAPRGDFGWRHTRGPVRIGPRREGGFAEHREEPVGVVVRQRLEQHAVDDGEDRRGERHAERDDAGDRHRIPGRLAQRADGLPPFATAAARVLQAPPARAQAVPHYRRRGDQGRRGHRTPEPERRAEARRARAPRPLLGQVAADVAGQIGADEQSEDARHTAQHYPTMLYKSSLSARSAQDDPRGSCINPGARCVLAWGETAT